MLNSRDGERVIYEGGRRFLAIVMDITFMGTEGWYGWFAFRRIEKACVRNAVDPDQLEHRYTEDNYGHIKAVFEVMPRV